MVAGHVKHAALGIILVTTLEVVLRVDRHITRGNEYVLVVRDIHTCRIVHFIIGTRSDGERRDGTLTMIEHRIDVGWEDTLILVVHLDGGIGPPQESLRQRRAVRHTTLNLEIGTTGAQREACHSFLVEHALHLVHPHRH